MNIIDGGKVVEVDFDNSFGFATIDINGAKLYVEFPLAYNTAEYTVCNMNPDPQEYAQWDIDFDCPSVGGAINLYNWSDDTSDLLSGTTLLDKDVVAAINEQLEIMAAGFAANQLGEV